MDRMRCTIMGATGIIGQRFVQMLSGHPWFELVQLHSSRADGKRTYGDTAKWMLGPEVPEEVDDIVLSPYGSVPDRKDVDVAFSALPSDMASVLERKTTKKGVHMISNSSFHRMDPDVPLIVPEINGDHLQILGRKREGGVLVTNPNCTTIGLVMALDPIMGLIEGEVHVSSYQAISGAGYPGVPSLDILGNVIPFINGEEGKLVEEPPKIFGRISEARNIPSAIKIVPNCVRVGVKDGHLVSFSCRLGKGVGGEEVLDALKSKKGLKGLPSAPERPLVLRKGDDRPRPDLDAFMGKPPGMVVSVGRVRVDNGMLRAFSLVNNTIRGGAGNAVLIAELLMKEGFI